MIKISIVTITYNATAVFMPTADSVMRQTYGNVEHIIVDGASPDGTADMAREYKRRSDAMGNGHEIRVVSEPDRGLYDAMNKGLQLATGDYVCFLNAGDFLPEAGTLETVAAKAMTGGRKEGMNGLPAVIYGNTDIVDNDNRYIGPRHLAPPENLNWRSFRNGMLVCHQAFYARLDIARKVSYDLRYRHSADVDWCIRVMKMAEKENAELVNTGTVIACYRREGQTTVYRRASLWERFDIMRCHYGLVTTVAMHLWFVVRAFCRKIH